MFLGGFGFLFCFFSFIGANIPLNGSKETSQETY